MKRLFNPFRYIAGAKALILGLIFIAAATLMLYSGSLIQDSYIHIGMAQAPLWYVGAMQIIWWLLPALLLYLCGIALSKSKIRIIDILGTTAFAQLILLLMIAPMLLPAIMNGMTDILVALQSGVTPTGSTIIPLMIYSIWSIVCLVLFYIWNYNAFAVSCNVNGWKAILSFIGVQIVVTIASMVL